MLRVSPLWMRWSSVLLLAATASASAEELRLGLQSQYVYNSNFFARTVNEEDANAFLIGPTLQLSDPEGRFRYEIDFDGGYEFFTDQSDVDNWETRLRTRLSYEIDSRTSIRLTNRFRDVTNLRFSRDDIAAAATALDPRPERYFRDDLELELTRDLSRFFELRLRSGYQWIDFEDNDDRNDSQAYEAGSELRYQVAPRQQVGVGATYVYQDYDEALSRLGSRAHYVNGFVSWNWQVSDEISLAASGGPAWVRSKDSNTNDVSQDRFVGGRVGGDTFRADFASCNQALASNCDFTTPGAPPIPAADLGGRRSFDLVGGERVGTDDELTFFGNASMLASFGEWNLQLIYSRRQSSTSGDALASVLDRASFEVAWEPVRHRWSPFIAGAWDRRETLTEATVVDFRVVPGRDGAAERDEAFTDVESNRNRLDNFTAIVGLRHALSRKVSGTFEFRYRRTEARDRDVTRDGIDTYFAVITLDYDHDVIRF